jgi:hypothetical protein
MSNASKRPLKKGRIEGGQLADLIVPDRDYFACAEDEIADTTSGLTVVGGKVVFGAGDFAQFDDAPPPPAMPDWSPVRTFGGYAAWGDKVVTGQPAVLRKAAEGKARGATCWSSGSATRPPR